MAAAVVEEESLSCPICFELFKIPRTLPCLHSFCEACLSSYITSSFLSKGQEPIGFNCPICRTFYSPTKTSSDPSTWVRSYHVNEVIQTKCQINKGEEVDEKPCDICEGEKNVSKFWCRECKACLCVNCNGNHAKFPGLSSHNVCDIQDISLGTSHSQSDSEICDRHPGRKYEMYCMDDEELCCTTCIVESHRMCDVIVSIPEAAKSVREKLHTFSLSTGLSNMEKENQVITEHAEHRLGLLMTNRAEFDRKMTHFREEIMKRIDSIEKHLTTDIDAKSEEFKKAYQKDLKMSKHRGMVICNLQRVLHASRAHSDYRMLVEINKVLMIYKRYQKDILDFRHNFREIDYHVSLDQMQEQFEKSLDCLGFLEFNISMNPEISLFQLEKGSIKILNKHFILNNAYITSGALLENGNIVIVDNKQQKLQTYDGKGTFISELVFTGKPWDVACINVNIVAVTIPERNIINIVHLSDMTVLKQITVEDGECYGVTYSRGKLAVSVCSKVLVMDTDGKIYLKIESPIYSVKYVMFKDKDIIMCTGGYDFCELKLNGTIVTNDTCSDHQRKLSIDCDNNVYIGSDKLYHFDKKTKHMCAKTLPKGIAESGMRVVSFQKNTNKFLLTWDLKFVGTFEIH